VAPEKGMVKMDNQQYAWTTWAEILKPFPGTKTMATYDNQFYKGSAAVTTKQLGKGTVTYIGVASSDGEIERQIIRTVYKQAGVTIENLPKGVFMEWRDGFYVAVNYAQPSFQLTLPKNSKLLIGTQPLQQGQALVWK
jgi:beta-galactosidase